MRSCLRLRVAAKIALFSVSYLALAAAGANQVRAQESPPAQAAPTNESPSAPAAPAQEPPSPPSAPSSSPAETPAPPQPDTTALPPVTVEAAQRKPRSASPVRSAQVSAPRPVAPPPSAPDPSAAIQAATVKNGTYFADFKKFYQHVYPGNGPLAGAVNPSNFTFNRPPYNHPPTPTTPSTPPTSSTRGIPGPSSTRSASERSSARRPASTCATPGLFPNGTNTEVDSAFAPTYFGPISFVHQFPGFFSPGITTPDSNSKYTLHTQ